jgi:hypothetical protein
MADDLIQWIKSTGERPRPMAEGSAVMKTWFKIYAGERAATLAGLEAGQAFLIHFAHRKS